MISRKTTLLLAEAYEERFVHSYRSTYKGIYSQTLTSSVVNYEVRKQALYDFLFANDYATWLCNKVHKLSGRHSVKSLIMRLHTGETQASATENWTWEQRRKLGQQLLLRLAEDFLRTGNPERTEKITRALELDGYTYRDGNLLFSESDVLDVQEEQGVLDGLYTSLQLDNLEMFRQHLKLSEEAYLAARWGDAIHNSRLVFEEVLREIATKHSLRVKGAALPERMYSKPIEVRQYLENEGLLETKEREVIQYTYGLLSNVGSHPYMAEKDQARLLRHMALTLSQFVLLRLEGSLKKGVQ